MEGTDRELFERSLRHAVESRTGTELDADLVDLGWHEALAEDAPTAVSVLFELQGAANAHSSALQAVLAHGLGLTLPPAGRLLLPAPGHRAPPGTVDHGGVTVHGLGLGLGGATADGTPTVVVVRNDDVDSVVDVPTGLTFRPVRGVDPLLGLVDAAGTDVPFAAPRDLAAGDWSRAVVLAQLAVGHELVGASRKMLELARAHALERVQFDRPIGSFQAVRHRLADTLVAIEAGDAVLRAAWEERSPEAAAMAKALVGRAARTGARHCQQVLAGIGFTTEHPFHRYVRRVLVLDELFGTAQDLTRELGSALLATRQLPPLPPL